MMRIAGKLIYFIAYCHDTTLTCQSFLENVFIFITTELQKITCNGYHQTK